MNDADSSAATDPSVDLVASLLSQTDTVGVLAVVTAAAVRLVPGACGAAVTRRRHGRFETVAPTDDRIATCERLQYDLGAAPGPDALATGRTVVCQDAGKDELYARFATFALAHTGVRSVAAFRIGTHEPDVCALSVYSDTVGAFGPAVLERVQVLLGHVDLAWVGALAHERCVNLERALDSNREIGVAMGVLMATHRIDRDQAFDLLRLASQDANRKLFDVARDIIDTGRIDRPAAAVRARNGPR